MTTLADIRASLKAGKSVSKPASKVAPISSKGNPLAALRAQIKAGKIKTPTAPPAGPVGIRGVTQP